MSSTNRSATLKTEGNINLRIFLTSEGLTISTYIIRLPINFSRVHFMSLTVSKERPFMHHFFKVQVGVLLIEVGGNWCSHNLAESLKFVHFGVIAYFVWYLFFLSISCLSVFLYFLSPRLANCRSGRCSALYKCLVRNLA